METLAALFLAVTNFSGVRELVGAEKIDDPSLRRQVWDNSSAMVTYWKSPPLIPRKVVDWRWVTVVPDYSGRGMIDAPYVQ